MTKKNKSVEIESDPVETLRFYADLIEKSAGKAQIYFFSDAFRSLADEIEQLLEDEIVITSSSGEEIATIQGPQATYIIKTAVEDFIKTAIQRSIAFELNEQEKN